MPEGYIYAPYIPQLRMTKEILELMEGKVKEINLKVEKIGVIHYFAIVSEDELEPQVCEDCGETVTRHSKVMGGKKDEHGKIVWKVVCNKCLNNYKSKDLDMPVTTKLEDEGGKPISRTSKPYKPYLHKCTHCEKAFDLYKVSMYNYDTGVFCEKCLKKVYGIDFQEPAP